jgi:hypothetical protein
MDPLRPGDPGEIGPYRLEARLGQGGMGQVFLGESPGGRKVAVKLIRAEHAADVRFGERFAREVEAARRVGGFHTAQVVDADPAAATPWIWPSPPSAGGRSTPRPSRRSCTASSTANPAATRSPATFAG